MQNGESGHSDCVKSLGSFALPHGGCEPSSEARIFAAIAKFIMPPSGVSSSRSCVRSVVEAGDIRDVGQPRLSLVRVRLTLGPNRSLAWVTKWRFARHCSLSFPQRIWGVSVFSVCGTKQVESPNSVKEAAPFGPTIEVIQRTNIAIGFVKTRRLRQDPAKAIGII